jgi:metal-dependent amidase/aminoacylase/carboxypeptidase family protein
MFNLGVVPPDRDTTAVHSPTFVADEAAIPVGVNLMATIILDHQMKPAKGTPKK